MTRFTFASGRRRVRMCFCPECGMRTRIEPRRDGWSLQICMACFVAFSVDSVETFLVDPLSYPEK